MPVNYDTEQFNVTASADLTRGTEEAALIISDNSDGSFCTVTYIEDESNGSWSVNGSTHATRLEASRDFDRRLNAFRDSGFVFSPVTFDGD